MFYVCSGYAAQSDVTAAQPVGYAAAYAAAKQRIAYIRSHSELTNNVPVVAVEGFIQEPIADRFSNYYNTNFFGYNMYHI